MRVSDRLEFHDGGIDRHRVDCLDRLNYVRVVPHLFHFVFRLVVMVMMMLGYLLERAEMLNSSISC